MLLPYEFHRSPKSWGYQLQNVDPLFVRNTAFDVLVVDVDDVPTDAVRQLQFKADGERRDVLSYISIGEAEGYRDYWKEVRADPVPSWLLDMNPEWNDNWVVKFWDRDYQRHIFRQLDKIIKAGYDGAYFDKCDAPHDIQRWHRSAARPLPEMQRAMISFILKLSVYARSKNPAFRIVMQNAEDLLSTDLADGSAMLVQTLSGVAKEDLLIGAEQDGMPNHPDMVRWSSELLGRVTHAGKPVFVVEYTDLDGSDLAELVRDLKDYGYVPYIAAPDRALDEMRVSNITGGKF